MSERSNWNDLREARMSEPGAADAYEAVRTAFELGAAARRPAAQGPGR